MITESLEDVSTVARNLAALSQAQRIGIIGLKRDGHITMAQAPHRIHSARLEIAADPAAVPNAQRWAEFVTSRWGLTVAGDTVGVVVSELLTNAVAGNAPTTAITPLVLVQLRSDSEALYIAVTGADEVPINA